MTTSNFDPDEATQARWLAAAGDIARRHLADLSASAPTSPVPVGRPCIDEAPFDGGIEHALAYVSAAADRSLPTTAPGFMAYIPGGGLFATAVADFVADVLNRYTGLAATAPELVALERDVVRWLAGEFGYGPGSTGVLTSGGSIAMFLAVTRARDAANDDGDLRRLVGYTSAQAHGSVAAAFRLAGVPDANLRKLPCDARFRMESAALEAAIRTDREAGRRPFMVVASAGTTNTGAIDPLPAIADLCRREALWMHVDAAYGGGFMLCDEGRRRLAGIERADSISFDPHKGLFLPYGTGCLLLRDGMAAGQDADEPYLRDVRTAEGGWSPADFGIELTRPYRGLRLWLPLLLHGVGAFRAALTHKLELADRLHRGLAQLGRGTIEIVAAPQLSVVAFARPRRPGEALADWNARNDRLVQAIHAAGRITLSTTWVAGPDGDRLVLRACVLSHRTGAAEVDALLAAVAAAREAGPETRKSDASLP